MVDKLIEGYTENIQEAKLAKTNSTENENKHKCSSCTLYVNCVIFIHFYN